MSQQAQLTTNSSPWRKKRPGLRALQGLCGKGSVAAVWHALKIPVIPVLTKTKSGVIVNICGEFSSHQPVHSKPVPETWLYHELVPERLT